MDKYDGAIAYLTSAPEQFKVRTRRAWNHPFEPPAGCLFQYTDRGEGFKCGCLTQVKRGYDPAPTDELTAAIRADPRIPERVADITPESLPAFAEWQRKLDAIFPDRVEGAETAAIGPADHRG